MLKNEIEKKQWVLVTGSPRSGTTMLGELINDHPNALILHEFHLERLLAKLSDLSRVVNLARQQEELDRTHAAANVDEALQESSALPQEIDEELDVLLERTDEFYESRDSRRNVVSWTAHFDNTRDDAIFHQLTESYINILDPAKRVKVVGDKLPGVNFAAVRQLREMAGPLKIVLIVRNPIDCVSSSMRRKAKTDRHLDKWDFLTPEGALRNWVADWNSAAETVAEAGFDTIVIEYDQLCERPGDVLKEVYSFLGLDPFVPSWAPRELPTQLRRKFVGDDQTAQIEHYLSDLLSDWDGAVPADLLKKYPRIGPFLPYGRKLNLADGAFGDDYLHAGFAGREGHGTWTDGDIAEIAFRHFRSERDLIMEFWLSDAIYDADSCAQFLVSINGADPSLFNIASTPRKISMLVPRALTRVGQDMSVKFHILSPKRSDDGPDPRRLGICFTAMRVSEAPEV